MKFAQTTLQLELFQRNYIQEDQKVDADIKDICKIMADKPDIFKWRSACVDI